MKERPVLFSAPMVRAILDGRKTVTRRIVKDQPDYPVFIAGDPVTPRFSVEGREAEAVGQFLTRCPYGIPGDRLWVRETFVIEDTREYWAEIKSRDGLPADRPVKWIDDDYFGRRPLIPHYRATEPEPHIVREETMTGPDDDRTRWMPSIFMPRWASRIDLEIVGVRVERLQEITHEDAIAEGCPGGHGSIAGYAYSATPIEHFRAVWETINGAGSWEANPWGWVVEFKRIT